MGDASDTAEVRYKIGEVCRLADVQPYVLRYWESEFSALAAPRGAQGPRTYSGRELKIVERIKQLLYDEGYTIAGAKKRLDGEIQSGTVFSAPSAARSATAEAAEAAADAEAPAPPPSTDTTPVKPPPDVRTARRASRRAPPQQPALDSVVFEDVALASAPEAPAEPAPAAAAKTTPVNHHADLRIPRLLSELREIQALLARDEP